MLSGAAKSEWLTILAIGVLVSITLVVVGWWPAAILTMLGAVALMAFFRDPERRIPTQRGAVVAPADGKVSSIHDIEHFEPFDGPAQCVRIFLSVLDVHINRSPCHGEVASITHKPGKYLNALNPESAEQNESNLLVLIHPIRRHPLAAVRQVSGMLARTIVCRVNQGQVLQRGERIGLIKLGSTTEVYLPKELQPQINVVTGQKVKAGVTIVATVQGREASSDVHPAPGGSAAQPAASAQPGGTAVADAEPPEGADAASADESVPQPTEQTRSS